MGRMYVVDFDTSTVTEMTELREMVTAAGKAIGQSLETKF
jgi:hypothetical protein